MRAFIPASEEAGIGLSQARQIEPVYSGMTISTFPNSTTLFYVSLL